jgi:hypothetical protein
VTEGVPEILLDADAVQVLMTLHADVVGALGAGVGPQSVLEHLGW